MSRKSIDTRNRILKCTWKLLETDGAQTSMSQIAKAAGLTRQAVYLHYPNRAELLIAVTRHIDEVKDVNGRLSASRRASSGRERLAAFVEAWGNYIPEIQGVAFALLAIMDRDEEARLAWEDRMRALYEGCEAAVRALEDDGILAEALDTKSASDILWTLLSVRNWRLLTKDCGWSQETYVRRMQEMAERQLTNSS